MSSRPWTARFSPAAIAIGILCVGHLLAVADLGRARDLTQRGVEALARGAPDKAREMFEDALASEPDFPDAHDGLGRLAMAEGRFEDAVERFVAARQGYETLGDRLYRVRMDEYNDVQRRIQGLQRQLRELGSGDVRTSAPAQMAAAADIRQAIQDLEAIPLPVREDFQEAPAELDYRLGNALSRADRRSEAIDAYESAVAKEQEFAEAHHNLALAYWRTGRSVEARRSLDRAAQLGMEIAPDLRRRIESEGDEPQPGVEQPAETPAVAVIDEASRLLDEGRLAEAEQRLERALERQPDLAEAGYLLATVYGETGRPDEALARFRQALERTDDPSLKVKCLLSVAEYERRRGELAAAITPLEAAVGHDPSLVPQVGQVLVDLSTQVGDLERAERWIAELPEGGLDPALHYNIAVARFNRREWEAAAAAFRKVLAADPEQVDAHKHLGFALLNLGRNDEALAHLKQYVSLRPEAPDVAQIRTMIDSLTPPPS